MGRSEKDGEAPADMMGRREVASIGFADQGKASGTYAAVDAANASALPELLKAVAATEKQSKI